MEELSWPGKEEDEQEKEEEGTMVGWLLWLAQPWLFAAAGAALC